MNPKNQSENTHIYVKKNAWSANWDLNIAVFCSIFEFEIKRV